MEELTKSVATVGPKAGCHVCIFIDIKVNIRMNSFLARTFCDCGLTFPVNFSTVCLVKFSDY